MTKKTKRTIAYTLAVLTLIAIMTAMLIMRNYVFIAEWWTMNISKGWNAMASAVSSLVPFSLFEWFIIFAIVTSIFAIIAGIALLARKKFHTFINSFLAVIIAVLVISNLYTMTAGFSYYREPLALTGYDQQISHEQTIDMYNYFATDFNSLSGKMQRDQKGNVIMPYSQKQLYAKLNQEFDKLDKNYYYSQTSNVKPILNSWAMTLLNVTGISFAPTGEANYSNQMPSSEKPFTIAHEIAHQRGVMREGDANTISEYIMLNSDDDYIRYCYYYQKISYIKYLVTATSDDNYDIETDNLIKLSPEISIEYKNGQQYWQDITSGGIYNFTSNISIFFNNLYLKFNGRQDGTGDYDNSGNHVDSGETDSDGNIIYEYEFSLTEKMYYQSYLNCINSHPAN